MVFLKTFLLLILALSLVWLSLLFAGPRLAYSFVSKLSDNQVILLGVEVTPNLSLNVPKIDFKLNLPNAPKKIEGSFRSVKVDWAILNGLPEIYLSAAIADIENYGMLEGISVKFSAKSFYDLGKLRTAASVKKLKLDNGLNFDAENIFAKGDLVLSKKNLSDVSYKIEEASLKTNAGVVDGISISGSLDKLKLNAPLSSQQNNLVVDVSKISGDQLLFYGEDAYISLGNFNSSLRAESEVSKLSLGTAGLTFQDVIIDGMFDNIFDPTGARIDFAISRILAQNIDGQLHNVVGKTALRTEEILIEADGLISTLILQNNDQFIARIDDGEFSLNANIENEQNNNSNRNTKISSELNIGIQTIPLLTILANFSFEVGQILDLLSCKNLECDLSDLNLSFRVQSSEQEALEGKFYCPTAACDTPASERIIKTMQTSSLFKSLSNSGIMNPLILAWIYSNILTGEEKNDTRTLEF